MRVRADPPEPNWPAPPGKTKTRCQICRYWFVGDPGQEQCMDCQKGASSASKTARRNRHDAGMFDVSAGRPPRHREPE